MNRNFLRRRLLGCFVVFLFPFQGEASSSANLVRFFPSKYLNAVTAYLDVAVSDEISLSSNRKLVEKSQSAVTEDPCFFLRAYDFYKSINDRDEAELNRLTSQKSNLIASTPLKMRPSLARPNKDWDEGFSEGWVWKEALEKTEGNPNLAMKMIGLCGHDDTARSFSLDKKKIFLDDTGKPSVPSDLESEKLLLGIKSFFGEYGENFFPCPARASLFYLPKSLGAEADIDETLKNEIARVQAPNLGAASLPAKYYHIYGAARIACEMKERGLGDDEIEYVTSKMPGIYRRMKICSKLKSLSSFDDSLGAKDILVGRAVKSVDVRVAIKAKLEKCFPKEAPNVANLNPSKVDSCSSFRFIMTSMGFGNLVHNILKVDIDVDKVTNSLASQIEAARLYRHWHLGGQDVAGNQIPCTDIRFGGPEDLEKSESANCGLGWTAKNCNEAKRILNSWKLDIKWTESQHAIGAKFALKHCKKNIGVGALSKVSCPKKPKGLTNCP